MWRKGNAISLVAGGVLLTIAATGCSVDQGPNVRLYDDSCVETADSPSGKSPVLNCQSHSATGKNSDMLPARANQSGYHIVRKGETLYAISRAYQVPIRSIIEVNKLKAPYTLQVRQKIFIPKRPVYRIKPGDTVYGISRRQGVSMRALVRINNLAPPYQIFAGQELLMPGRVVAVKGASTPDRFEASNPPPIRQKKSASPGLNYAASRITQSGFPRPYPKPEEPARKLAAIAKPPARVSSKFLWPVKGKLISAYGAKGKGLYNDGLNIAAPSGSPIKAAENGVVVYSGTELKGYGKLILLKHADGYLTAYAHNSANLVARGQRIKRGQIIGKIGQSGNVQRPQLHFQIRRGKQTVNPKKYLGQS